MPELGLTPSFLASTCDPNSDCPACLTATGRLCHRHERDVLPQLAVNVGWLKLMGDPKVEQTKRQKPIPVAEKVAVERIGRRNARKQAKNKSGGPFGFAKAISRQCSIVV
jgi:hypothetical protein